MAAQERFPVKQSHLRKVPKTIEICVGSMGLQLFGAKGKPLESYLYESMTSWQVEPSGFSVRSGPEKKKLIFGTEEGNEIVRRIALAAREIGKQYLIDKGTPERTRHAGLEKVSAELERHASVVVESRAVSVATDWLNARYHPTTVAGLLRALRATGYAEEEWLGELELMDHDGTLADLVSAIALENAEALHAKAALVGASPAQDEDEPFGGSASRMRGEEGEEQERVEEQQEGGPEETLTPLPLTRTRSDTAPADIGGRPRGGPALELKGTAHDEDGLLLVQPSPATKWARDAITEAAEPEPELAGPVRTASVEKALVEKAVGLAQQAQEVMQGARTQNEYDEAAQICQSALEMDRGCLLAEGMLHHIRSAKLTLKAEDEKREGKKGGMRNLGRRVAGGAKAAKAVKKVTENAVKKQVAVRPRSTTLHTHARASTRTRTRTRTHMRHRTRLAEGGDGWDRSGREEGAGEVGAGSGWAILRNRRSDRHGRHHRRPRGRTAAAQERLRCQRAPRAEPTAVHSDTWGWWV